MKNLTILFAIAAMTTLFSCGTTDIDPPTICTENVENGISTLDEVDADAGTTVTLLESFCDDEGLGEVRWDIHSAEGHSHEGEEEEGFVLHSGTDWSVLEIQDLSGSNDDGQISFDIPNTVRGVWDVVVSFSDAEGNAAADVVTPLHVENDFIPLFTLTNVNGVDPATWTEEQVWSAGSTVTLTGTVEDSDGIADAEVLLIRESDETEIWSTELEVLGASIYEFSVTLEVPESANSGEYHLEMEAEDALGNAMHTGFHLEIE